MDRAALDWAIRNGVPHGGWCPRGRKAEDRPISSMYALRETELAGYLQRTRQNVMDSDTRRTHPPNEAPMVAVNGRTLKAVT